MAQWTEESRARCGDASRQAWADSRPWVTATSHEGIMRECERILAVRRAGRPVHRRVVGVLNAAGGLDLTDDEAREIGGMLVALLSPEPDYDRIAAMLRDGLK